MQSIANLIKQLQRDEDGASMIEYTVLLAIILIAVIGLIAAVGSWVSSKWSGLNSALVGH
jgi:pilus assembly protein Flp/PilA